MRNKIIIGSGIMFVILLAVFVLANVSSVTLNSPSDDIWTNQTNNTIGFSFSFVADQAQEPCTLEIDGQGTNCGTNATADNNTDTILSSTCHLANGTHAWNVRCGVGEVRGTERTINIDTINPVSSDNAPTGWMDSDVTIIITSTDDGLSPVTNYSCIGSGCSPQAQNSRTVTQEGNNTVRYYARDSAGNAEDIQTVYVALDKTDPTIILGGDSPINSQIYYEQNIFNFTFNVTDYLSDTMNCSFYIGQVSASLNDTNASTQNGTPTSFLNKQLLDGLYVWYVGCSDLAQNYNESDQWTFTVDVAPHNPVIYAPETVTDQSSINLYGYVNRSSSNVTVYTEQGVSATSVSQVTNESSNQTGIATIYADQVSNSSYFFVDKELGVLPSGFGIGNYTEFSGHQSPYLLRYQIIEVTEFADRFRINISPNLADDISTSDSVFAYNQSKPSGWFNITVPLYSGANNLTIGGTRMGSNGPLSSIYTVFSDVQGPVVNLTAVAGYNFSTATPTINFTVEDDYSLNLTSIRINISDDTSSILYNYSNISQSCSGQTFCTVFLDTELNEGSYNITVDIDDILNNSGTAMTNFSIIIPPIKPLVWTYDAYVNESVVYLVGIVGGNNTLVNATVEQGELMPYINQTTSTQGSNLIITTDTMRQTIPSEQFCIYVNKTLNESFVPGTWMQFINHYKQDGYFERYNISNKSNIFEGGENQYYTQVCLQDNLSYSVPSGTSIYVYDTSLPAGWFNISISLRPGPNNITLIGSRYGLVSEESNLISIYYDNEAPYINTSNIPGNTTSNNPSLSFRITDGYAINITTLGIAIYNQVANITQTYNVSNSSCSGTLFEQDCSFIPDLIDGNYTINISVSDYFNQTNLTVFEPFIVQTVAPNIAGITDPGVTTSTSQLYINWTNENSTQFFSHYQLALGTEQYPTAGYDSIRTWYNLSENYANETWNITPGYAYYFNVRVVDLLGNLGNVTSTNGIVYEDNTVPEMNNISIIGTSASGAWTNDDGELSATWNFTDNETGISHYEYAIGNAVYPLIGWDSAKSITQTTLSSLDVPGLSLEENISYYFSVRARNNYQYGYGWSDWYTSTASIKVDVTDPSGGTIYYTYGNYTANSITLSYGTGEDNYSGIERAALMYATAAMDPNNGGQCQAYSSYNEITNVTPLVPGTVTTYDYNGLENGNCYRFGLYVWDYAGNRQEYYLGNQIYNVSVDSTGPQTFTITDDGHLTGSTTLDFSWTAAVDTESGIDYYEYSLEDSLGTKVLDWTYNGLLSSVHLTNLNLTDEETYYLTVRAWNHIGLATNVTSNGIIYLDLSVPTALTVTSVDDSTSSDNISGYDLWVTTDTNTNVTINLTGEQGLACVWSYYDITFTQPSPATNYSWWCDNSANATGEYSCTAEGITEGWWHLYVTCRDAAGNKQTQNENTDVDVKKENAAPIINITSPENGSVVDSYVVFNLSIFDASDYNISFYFINSSNNEVVEQFNASSSGYSIITLDLQFLDLVGGDYMFVTEATDAYNHTSNSSIIFIIDNDAPTINIIADSYYSDDFNLILRAALYTNLTYNITNSSGSLIQENSWNYALRQNLSIISEFVNVTTLPEGAYTIIAVSTDNNSNNRTDTETFVIDKTDPEYKGSTTYTPTSNLYENETITLYLNWKELTAIDDIWVRHNANGSVVNYSATNTSPGAQIYENATRYMVEILPYLLSTNESITYTWHARDMAGNEESYSAQTVNVSNRAPILAATNLTDALANVTYQQIVYFEDLDDSQNNASYFECSVSGAAGMTASVQSNTVCLLEWINPVAGTYTLDVTVNDTLNSAVIGTTTRQYNLTVQSTTQQNNTIDSSHTLIIEYDYNGTIFSTTSASGDFNVTLPSSYLYNLTISVDNLIVLTPNYNVSDNLDIFFQLLNPDLIDDNNTDVGSARRYVPLESYAFRINSNHTDNYTISFDYAEYNVSDPTQHVIFKYGYDELGDAVNYTDYDNTTITFVDTTSSNAYIVLQNFSTFVLTYDSTGASIPGQGPVCTSNWNCSAWSDGTCGTRTCVDLNACVPPSSSSPSTSLSCGSGSSSSSSSSRGAIYYVPPSTCDDGILNQDEIGIDCGGSCDACQTCHDGVKNQNETGIDCGGSCSACPVVPVVEPTCTDRKLNGDETGIDCGGSCEPCDTCKNGLWDINEEAKDCGGDCPNACPKVIEKVVKDPIVEKPVKSIPKYLWIIIAGIMLSGTITGIVLYKKGQKLPEPEPEETAEEQEVTDLKNEERDVMSRYIFNYLSQGLTEENIRNQLVVDGFKQPHVDTVMSAVLRDSKLLEIQDYFNNYTKKGYTVEELREWVQANGIPMDLLDEALQKREQGLGPSSPTQATIEQASPTTTPETTQILPETKDATQQQPNEIK